MIILYLFVKGIRACVWCLGWMIWGCLAFAGVTLVLFFGAIAACFGDHGRAIRAGLRAIRPPGYLIRKSRG